MSPAVDPEALGRKGQETEAAAWVLDAELEESPDPDPEEAAELEDPAELEDSEEVEAAALSPEEDSDDSELLAREEVLELAESVE